MDNTLTIADSSIRCIGNLYSLNDLHKASGGLSKHQPRYWLANKQAKELIHEIQNSEIPLFKDEQICAPKNSETSALKITSDKSGGTYACKELVIAYAAWISPAFHLKVIRVFLEQNTHLPQPQLSLPAKQPKLEKQYLPKSLQSQMLVDMYQYTEQLKGFDKRHSQEFLHRWESELSEYWTSIDSAILSTFSTLLRLRLLRQQLN